MTVRIETSFNESISVNANPINGGGMCNAIKSAKALSESISENTINTEKYVTLLRQELQNEWKDAQKNRRRIKLICQHKLLRFMTGTTLALFGGMLVPRLYRKAIAH